MSYPTEIGEVIHDHHKGRNSVLVRSKQGTAEKSTIYSMNNIIFPDLLWSYLNIIWRKTEYTPFAHSSERGVNIAALHPTYT